jgi:hypothetical protein
MVSPKIHIELIGSIELLVVNFIFSLRQYVALPRVLIEDVSLAVLHFLATLNPVGLALVANIIELPAGLKDTAILLPSTVIDLVSKIIGMK